MGKSFETWVGAQYEENVAQEQWNGRWAGDVRERERASALPNNTKFVCGPKDEDDDLAMI